jgi:hypothetical protein
MKALKVVVIFEFNGIDRRNSVAADKIVDKITVAREEWRVEHGADSTWIDEVFVDDVEEV